MIGLGAEKGLPLSQVMTRREGDWEVGQSELLWKPGVWRLLYP
jgi:hypothetical protein